MFRYSVDWLCRLECVLTLDFVALITRTLCHVKETASTAHVIYKAVTRVSFCFGKNDSHSVLLQRRRITYIVYDKLLSALYMASDMKTLNSGIFGVIVPCLLLL